MVRHYGGGHANIGARHRLTGDPQLRRLRQQRQREQHPGDQLGRLVPRQLPVSRRQRAGHGDGVRREAQPQLTGDGAAQQPVRAGEHRVRAPQSHEKGQQEPQGTAAVAAVHHRCFTGGQAVQCPAGRQYVLRRVRRQGRGLSRQIAADQLPVQQAFRRGHRHRALQTGGRQA